METERAHASAANGGTLSSGVVHLVINTRGLEAAKELVA
jgi:hypothetical protein